MLLNLSEKEAFYVNLYLDLIPNINAQNILYYLDAIYDFSKEEKAMVLKIILDSDKLIKNYIETKNKSNKKQK